MRQTIYNIEQCHLEVFALNKWKRERDEEIANMCIHYSQHKKKNEKSKNRMKLSTKHITCILLILVVYKTITAITILHI